MIQTFCLKIFYRYQEIVKKRNKPCTDLANIEVIRILILS